jgi:hypothetical protein
MRPFDLGDRTIDNNMIYLAVIVSALSFDFKVCV